MFVFLIPILSWIWSTIGKYLVMAGVFAAAVGAFALAMFEKGKGSEKQVEAKATAKTIATTKAADESVNSMTDDQVSAALKKWETK